MSDSQGEETESWMCPHCNDFFDADDEDVPPVCDMCRKAGRS